MSHKPQGRTWISLAWVGLTLLSIDWATQLGAATTESWEKILAAAKREGKVVIIGPPVASHRGAILKFEEAFPGIRLEFSGLAPAQFEPRIAKEREFQQYLWDVIVSGISSTVFTRQIPAGWFDPVKPAVLLAEVSDDRKWLGGFDGGFMDKAKKFAYAFTLNVNRNIYVNRDIVPETEFRSVEDLLDSRWRGKVAWNGPRLRAAGSATFAHLRQILSDADLKRLLVDQQPVITSDIRQLAEWVVRGRYPIGIGVSDTDLTRFQQEGVAHNVRPIDLAIERVSPSWGGVMLMNRAPHPNATQVFLNWLLGQNAQKLWAETGGTNSRRLDVPPGDPDTAPDAKKLPKYLSASTEENAAMREDAMALAKSLLK